LGIVASAALAALLSAIPASAEPIELRLPIDCEPGRSCAIQHYVDHAASTDARDYRCGTRTYLRHNGTDFRLPDLVAQRTGVKVLAAADGHVVRVRDGVPDVGSTQSAQATGSDRACGNGVVIAHDDEWETQYCHLAQGSIDVKPGQRLEAGRAMARVGLSGATEFPHLHFTVRWRGTVVDPFAFGAPQGACEGGQSLWNAALREALAYDARVVLNAGFSAGAVTMQQIESGEAGQPLPTPQSPALAAFVRAIGLKKDDVQRLSIKAPDGRIFVDHRAKPLESNKAQFMIFVGRKLTQPAWQTGTYEATYSILSEGKVVLEKSFAITF
jgi:hypothetical protein